VVKDEEGKRFFPAGKYVPQTRISPPDSVGEWAKDGQSVANEDIILFLTFGTNHIPRPEDWPVMPVEHLRVTLKPNNFFKWSPAIDVRPESNNNSKLASDKGPIKSELNGTNDTMNGHHHLEDAPPCCVWM